MSSCPTRVGTHGLVVHARSSKDALRATVTRQTAAATPPNDGSEAPKVRGVVRFDTSHTAAWRGI